MLNAWIAFLIPAVGLVVIGVAVVNYVEWRERKKK